MQKMDNFSRVAWRVKNKMKRVLSIYSSPDADSVIREGYDQVCRIGRDSENPWIKRSSYVPGWLFQGEHEFIYQQALNAPPGNFIEVGVLFGKSTSILAGAIEERGRSEKIFAIDSFTLAGNEHDQHVHHVTHGLQSSFDVFVKQALDLKYYHHVIPIATFSTLCLPFIQISGALAFIDACHEQDAVETDFSLIYPKLVPGAVVLFHDAINETFPGVMKAVNRILEQYPEYEQIGQGGTIVAIKHRA